MRSHPGGVLSAAVGVAILGASYPAPARGQGDLFIKDGTLLTITRGVIEKGSILIEKGKIARIGEDLRPPPGVTVIDATGKYVMPGIIDTHSHMGVYAWPGVEANADGNEATAPVTAQVRVADALNPADPAIYRALAGGVTTVQVLPGSANVVGGLSAVIKLKWGKTLGEMLFPGAPPGIKMAMGENPKRVYGERNQLPSTRMGNFFVLREAFVKAQEYMQKWERYEVKRAKGEEAEPPDRDLKLETLADVLRGKIRVHVHCYRHDEMLNLMKIADEFGFKIASFQHSLEAYKVADEIARRGIGVATWADWWGFKLEAWDATPYNAALCSRAGVRVNIHSDSSDGVQRLYLEAAKTIRYGQTEEEALKTITIHPAAILGIDGRGGSLEEGKDADIAIFSRHPFDIYTLVEKTIIDGEVVFDRATATGL